MKSLLDIQRDIRNLENDIALLSSNIRQINNDIDELRNRDNSMDFDYAEIKKLSKRIPFKKHPISGIKDENTAKLYLEMLINIIKLDDKNEDDKIDTRLIFIQWILDHSKVDITLEELVVNTLKADISDFDEISTHLSKKYKEMLVVDLLIIANMNGIFNTDECDYVVSMLTVLDIDKSKLRILSLIAKIVLCQKIVGFDYSLGDDLIKELGSYKHYIIPYTADDANSEPTDIIREAIKYMRRIVIKHPLDKGFDFKWKVKQRAKVTSGAVMATYQHAKKKRGYSWIPEYITEEILAPDGGTIFQFKDNNIIYGVLSYEADDKDAIKQWVKNDNKK